MRGSYVPVLFKIFFWHIQMGAYAFFNFFIRFSLFYFNEERIAECRVGFALEMSYWYYQFLLRQVDLVKLNNKVSTFLKNAGSKPKFNYKTHTSNYITNLPDPKELPPTDNFCYLFLQAHQ